VSPLYLFLKNLATFFDHRCHYHYRFLLLSLGCHPLQGVTPHLFYLSNLVVSPLFFVNVPTKFFSFLKGVTRGGPPPPCDATGGEATTAKKVITFQRAMTKKFFLKRK